MIDKKTNYEQIVRDVITEYCQKKQVDVYDIAWYLIERAKQKAESLQLNVVITVVDQAGQMVMYYRMKEALIISNDMAYKKAYSCVAMKMATKDLAKLTQAGQDLYQLETMSGSKLVSLPGGIPIYHHGKVIGGIGVSGGSLIEDQQIAEYALMKWENK